MKCSTGVGSLLLLVAAAACSSGADNASPALRDVIETHASSRLLQTLAARRAVEIMSTTIDETEQQQELKIYIALARDAENLLKTHSLPAGPDMVAATADALQAGVPGEAIAKALKGMPSDDAAVAAGRLTAMTFAGIPPAAAAIAVRTEFGLRD